MAPAIPRDIRTRLHRASSARFATALAISLAIHALSLPRPGINRAPPAARPLLVQLVGANFNSALDLPEAMADRPALTESEVAAGPRVPLTHHARPERSRPPAAVARDRTLESAPPALARAIDERYYEATDLDRYPQLPALVAALRAPGAMSDLSGRVRVLVSVNEFGTVDAVSFLAGNRASLVRVREVLRAMRFLPGEKDGRAVKSRVVIEFDGSGERRAH